MNLIGNSSNKTSLPEKNIKEKFLSEEIQNLRGIYQEVSRFYQKINSILKKTIEYNAQTLKKSDCQISIINNFIDDLSQMEDIFLLIVQIAETDNEHFSSTIKFRPYNKYNEAISFRNIMKSHEDFKEKLNHIIHKLEKDIQKLQTNGYHIYDTNIKPNNVLNNLKKATIDKYIITLNEMNTVFDKIKAQIANKNPVDKKLLKVSFKNDIQKLKNYYKILQQILLKQKLVKLMMTEQINTIKIQLEKYNRKIKDIKESISMNKSYGKRQHTEIKILLTKYQEMHDDEYKEYMQYMKEKTNQKMIVTTTLYDMSRKRSKSCNNIMQTSRYDHPLKVNNLSNDSGSCQSSTHIMGSDILQSFRID